MPENRPAAGKIQRRLVVEQRYTRDRREPIDGDWDLGWTCTPVPPDDSGQWHIFDTSSDRKTGWRRVRAVVVQ